MQNLRIASMHHYTYYFQSVFFFLLESVSSSLDLPPINLIKMTLHTNNRMSRMETIASVSTAMTSSRKYWYQARSSTAERK